MLRDWFNRDDISGAEKARHLIEQVLGTGIESFREPPTLPPIGANDVELVCWMAITPSS